MRLVAQFVEHFDPVDHFGGQVFDGRRNVLPEKFLTVDQHFFNLFALRFDVAAFHFDTRAFFPAIFHVDASGVTLKAPALYTSVSPFCVVRMVSPLTTISSIC